ncbi:hypothetical protein [Candidatus Korarchaeum cryptofilum]|jgi:hypothetical protein|uniref:hypothetical protein n=1 Tax=Candidatus Korarchaeum cryptofilum TaxID=498846 RepID=UPI00163D265F|nr:hypothetical protein [Candidatus Korarchaeum cryptofilum]
MVECAIEGCQEEAKKEVDRSYLPVIQSLKLKLKAGDWKKIPLCKKHYKIVKEAKELQT